MQTIRRGTAVTMLTAAGMMGTLLAGCVPPVRPVATAAETARTLPGAFADSAVARAAPADSAGAAALPWRTFFHEPELVQLIDTAGIRRAENDIEAEGVVRAQRAAETADLVLLVIDRSQSPSKEVSDLLRRYPDAIVVMNKSDLSDAWGPASPPLAIAVSAQRGSHIDDLIAAIVRRLVPDLPPEDLAIPVCERHAAWLQAPGGQR